MSLLESIDEVFDNNGFVKILDKIDVDDIKEAVKDTASIIKDVSEIVSEVKDSVVSETKKINEPSCNRRINRMVDTINYKLEDFKYWCQLRMTDVEFSYNMAKAELQVENLSDYCKCSIIMMFVFIIVHMIAFVSCV